MNRCFVLGLTSLVLSCVGAPGDLGDVTETDPTRGQAASSEATPGSITGSSTSTSPEVTTAVDTSGSAVEDGSSSSGLPVKGDPCRQFETGNAFDQCPEGCRQFVLGVLDDPDSCSWFGPEAICVTEGEPLEFADYRAYWAEEDGQIYGVFIGPYWTGEVTPSTLPQCTGGPADDPLCYCLGVDLTVMLECGLPAECPYVSAYDPTTFADSDCTLAALRDRTPATLSFLGGFLGGLVHSVFVHEDGTATVSVQLTSDTFGFRPSSPTQRCVIPAPQYFEECIAITDERDKASCLDPLNWLLDCVPQAPSCG